MKQHPAFAQVDLLIQILPLLHDFPRLALKGGTAINLFVRALPRLSVDIDLVYVPLDPCEVALRDIDQALTGLTRAIARVLPDARVQPLPAGELGKVLVVQRRGTHVKVELDPLARGCVYPCRQRPLHPAAQELFGRFATVRTVDFGDLYGSKLCAALDRQHPRDLFDVHLLLRHEGMTARPISCEELVETRAAARDCRHATGAKKPRGNAIAGVA